MEEQILSKQVNRFLAKSSSARPNAREIAFTVFDKNDVTPSGLSYIKNTVKAIILLSLRDLKARMAGISIGSIG